MFSMFSTTSLLLFVRLLLLLVLCLQSVSDARKKRVYVIPNNIMVIVCIPMAILAGIDMTVLFVESMAFFVLLIVKQMGTGDAKALYSCLLLCLNDYLVFLLALILANLIFLFVEGFLIPKIKHLKNPPQSAAYFPYITGAYLITLWYLL